MANYNLSQAIDLFNQDQVRTQTMYQIDFYSGIDKIDNTLKRMQVWTACTGEEPPLQNA